MAGIAIGLPTLRLRGDYIAVVTLAFGEIVGRFAINGNQIRIGGIWDQRSARCRCPDLGSDASLTARQAGDDAGRQDRPAVRRPVRRRSTCGPGTWSRWRSSSSRSSSPCACATRARAGPGSRSARTRSRPSSMGIPLVRTKLLAYGDRRRLRRRRRRLPRLLPEHGQRRPVPVLVLDLHPRDGDPRRPRLDQGCRARRGGARRSSTTA